MSPAHRLTLVCAWFGIIACSTLSKNSGARTERAGGADFYPEELAFIRADSELFEGVVNGQLAATDKEPPYHLESPRFDARPYGSDSAFSSYTNGFELEDSTFPGLVRRPVIARIIANRKSILSRLNVIEGGRRPPSACPGILVGPLHPASDSAYREELGKLRSGCPKKPDYYVSVGLPIRGIPTSVRQRMSRVGLKPDLPGEVWTELVETTSVGPSGGMWTMYVWLFRRDPTTSKLKLAKLILFGIAE